MDEFKADLHCHTTCSDGTSSPKEVVEMAKKIGLSGLSITDHDTIDAYKEAVETAKELEIDLISGIEFSCMHKSASVHILSYSFPLNSPLIEDFCKKHAQRRRERNEDIIKLINQKGMPITNEDVEAMVSSHVLKERRIIGRPHIALAMMKKGYVKSVQEAFNLYLGENKCCFAPGPSFSVEYTIDLIHEAKGLAVIAHPQLIDSVATLKDLLDMKFDGIECYYARFMKDASTRWLKIAHNKNWLKTGGSDYHGSVKPNNYLGSSYVNRETFEILKDHFIKVNT